MMNKLSKYETELVNWIFKQYNELIDDKVTFLDFIVSHDSIHVSRVYELIARAAYYEHKIDNNFIAECLVLDGSLQFIKEGDEYDHDNT